MSEIKEKKTGPGRPTKDTVGVDIRIERWLDEKVRAEGKPTVVIDRALRAYYGVKDV